MHSFRAADGISIEKLRGFHSRLNIFQRGLKRNLLAGRVYPVNIKCRVGSEKNQTRAGTDALGLVDMMRGQVREVPMPGNASLVVFHLHLKRAADDHRCFTGSMPVERSYAAGSELGEKNGRALTRIAFVDRYRKTFGSVRDGAKLGAGGSCDNWLLFSTLSVQAERRAGDAR